MSQSGGIQASVQCEVLAGHLNGPWLTDAKTSDRQGPFEGEPIPPGTLSLADPGFFGIEHLSRHMQRRGRRKRSVITRLLSRTALSLRNGHRLELRGVLPQQVGGTREIGVMVGQTARLPMRLILVRVPKDVGEQRRP